MKKTLLFLFILNSFVSLAGPGDTTWVQTFNFDTINTRRANFQFPDDSKNYSKVLMYYRLKCDSKTTRDQYDCGEWDYLTYTYVYDHTGKMDSTQFSHVNYMVNGATPDEFNFTTNKKWAAYKRSKETNDFSETSVIDNNFGIASNSSMDILNASHLQSRAQFVWNSSELAAQIANPAAPITSIVLNLASASGNNVGLAIRMRNSNDALTSGNRDKGTWTTVYDQPFSTSISGAHKFKLNTPFVWDGSSNLIIEFLCDNKEEGNVDYAVETEMSVTQMGLASKMNNYYLDFEGADAVLLPKTNFKNISDEITIALWTFGDENIQPQNNYTFEGLDSDGKRSINSHLPWSNGQVYWDAGGEGGSYDRINKVANKEDYEGKWNHWTFTKNSTTGSMKIYLNGNLWHSGNGNSKKMNDLQTLVIGSRGAGPGNGSGSFDGFIDDFAVWNKELSAAEILQIVEEGIKSAQGSADKLQYYFNFNEESSFTTTDASNNALVAQFLGMPNRIKSKALELWYNFESLNYRPLINLQQGVVIDNRFTVVYYDTVIVEPVSLTLFENLNAPNVPTDTIYGWEAGYSYTYDENGMKSDSVLIASTRNFTKKENKYYGDAFEVVNRYEIARYITPYGKGLSLGPNGFLWMFDVTDYQDLLTDIVDLAAHNRQELIDLKFAFIEGEPARNPISILNLYSGAPTYSTDFETWAKPKKYLVTNNAERVVVKLRLTGHGFGGNENCSEFCSKRHNIQVNGEEVWARKVWRDDCGYNPVQPQGGTWVYNRANWCPGAEVETYEVDITDYITKGDSVEIDFSAEAYTWNGAGSRPYYRTEIQVMEFKDSRYSIDASVENIVSPSNADLFNKINPTCGRPEIIIRNNGKNRLKTVGIFYGLEGEEEQFYYWKGDLGFLELDTVFLNPLNWDESGKEEREFKVRLDKPNKSNDENPINDYAVSIAELPPVFEPFYIELKTNNAPQENEYFITDINGNEIFRKNNLTSNTTYRDTFDLPFGCYNFTLTDAQENGLSWWAAAAQGNGYVRIRKLNRQLIQSFDSDFGAQVSQNFVVGKTSRTINLELSVMNNPSDGIFLVDIPTITETGSKVTIYNRLGQIVEIIEIEPSHSQTIEMDITGNVAGIYFAQFQLPGQSKVIKLMLK